MSLNLEKLTLGAFAYFVEAGTTVDGITVSAAAYPDVDPTDNWDSLGCISEVDFETEEEAGDDDWCASAAGGYDKISEPQVVADYIKLKSREMNEMVWRLKLGLKNKIVNGTAQTPFESKSRYIEGWLKIQGRANDGVDRVVMNVWGRLSLDAAPKWSRNATKPALKFQKLYSSIATVEPNNIA